MVKGQKNCQKAWSSLGSVKRRMRHLQEIGMRHLGETVSQINNYGELILFLMLHKSWEYKDP